MKCDEKNPINPPEKSPSPAGRRQDGCHRAPAGLPHLGRSAAGLGGCGATWRRRGPRKGGLKRQPRDIMGRLWL